MRLREFLGSDDRGAVGGLEGLAFGVLIFVSGMLLIMSVWTVIDTKMAVAMAAREAVRSYVETPAEAGVTLGRVQPMERATNAAILAMGSYGKRAGDVQVRAVDDSGATVAPLFERCEPIRIEVSYPIELSLPYADEVTNLSASATASELVDPLRAGLGGEAGCVGA